MKHNQIYAVITYILLFAIILRAAWIIWHHESELDKKRPKPQKKCEQEKTNNPRRTVSGDENK